MLEPKKVFISGPMTGYLESNRPAFMEAEKELKAAGFTVVNPATFGIDDLSNVEIARIDLTALLSCNYIYQLEGWENSTGATAEWQAAKWAGIMPVNKAWLDWYTGTEMPEAMAETKEEREHSGNSRLYAFAKEARDNDKLKEDLLGWGSRLDRDEILRVRMGSPVYE